jgi:hypothetical protein
MEGQGRPVGDFELTVMADKHTSSTQNHKMYGIHMTVHGRPCVAEKIPDA